MMCSVMSHYPPPMPPQSPIPVQPVSYLSPYASRGRPGILTAVGVMSIVVACFSFLGSLSGAFMALGFAMITATPARFAPPAATVVQPSANAPVVSGGLILSPDDAFQGSEVDVIVHSMN